MTRIEIFTNRSVEENLMEAFMEHGVADSYSKIPTVHGKGSSGPRQGDAIWPEENVAFIIYCEDDEARLVKAAVEKVKKEYPDEGIKLFSLEDGWKAAPRRPKNAELEAPDSGLALPAPKKSRSAKPRVAAPAEKRALPPPVFGGETT